MIARSRLGRRQAAASVAVVVAGAVFAGCTAPAPSPTPSPPPASVAPASPPAATPVPSSAVGVDPGLLDLLPEAVGGLPFEPAPDAAAKSVDDPDLAEHAEALAVAIAADPAGSNFVVASVVKLQQGAFDDDFFRDWRDSFDEGVCSQAGGVTGNAEATIEDRKVFIGTCGGGVHTYHVHLANPDRIVSLNVVGDPLLGDQLMASLRT
ncbi:MAG: hypothetical protein ACJ765_12240 [Chloroflexota bacterium]